MHGVEICQVAYEKFEKRFQLAFIAWSLVCFFSGITERDLYKPNVMFVRVTWGTVQLAERSSFDEVVWVNPEPFDKALRTRFGRDELSWSRRIWDQCSLFRDVMMTGTYLFQ